MLVTGLRTDWKQQTGKQPQQATAKNATGKGPTKKGHPTLALKQGLGDSDIKDVNPYKKNTVVEDNCAGAKVGKSVEVVDGRVQPGFQQNN